MSLATESTPAGEHESSTASRAMNVSSDGTIRAELPNVSDGNQRRARPRPATNVEDVWPGALSSRIIRNVRRVLRDRGFRTDTVHDDEHEVHADFIYVASGADTVTLVVRDLGRRGDELRRLHELAYQDEATSLPNREMFLNELHNVVEFQRLREGRAAAIILHVETVADSSRSLGNSQFNEYLAEIASRLHSELRGTNLDDRSDQERRSVLSRTDFRDFGIILPSIESGEDAEAVAKRLIKRILEPVVVGNRSVGFTAIAGIALFPQDGGDPAALFDNAVAAMEDAACSDDKMLKFHTNTVKLRTLQRQDLELELRSALDTNEFSLHYQPIVVADNGRIHTVEALLRWPDSILGTRSTRKLISVAERTNLAAAIGKWVLRTSCEQLMRWRQAGCERLRLAVNVSPHEFSRSDLVETVSGVLFQTGLQPSVLDIEINEHILFRDAMKDYATCRKLKSLGVRIVVDDYGIGSCSLAHLAHSPVDAVKIDHALVACMETNGRDGVACDAAIALAHALGLDVVAEGVETEEQARLLTERGCDYLQGYHYFAPMSVTDFSAFVDAPDDDAPEFVVHD